MDETQIFMKKSSSMHFKPLARRVFLRHLSKNVLLGCTIMVISLVLGMAGYHYFEQMDWVDAYVNAAMILSGMGPLGPLHTEEGKLFAGTYALFSGVVFLVVVGIVFAPIIHWFFHKFHIPDTK